MRGSALPTTLAFCCRVPSSLSATDVSDCLDAASGQAIPVTWVTTVERLPLLLDRSDRSGSGQHVAIDLPSAALESRPSLRQLLAAVRSAGPNIDTALVRGPLSQDCRRMLVDAGIGVTLRDRFDPVSRGPRRPAPAGWPCRSMLWGLWEVTTADATPPGVIGRLLPWSRADRLRPGGLAVLDLTGATPSRPSIRDRLDRWQTWARRQGQGAVDFATVSALPDLVTGAARRPLSGSILKAA